MNVNTKCKLDFYHCPLCRDEIRLLIGVLYSNNDVLSALKAGAFTFDLISGVFRLRLKCGGFCEIEDDRGIANITSWKC